MYIQEKLAFSIRKELFKLYKDYATEESEFIFESIKTHAKLNEERYYVEA